MSISDADAPPRAAAVPAVTFEPSPTGSGSHCFVLVTWPSGRTVHLGDFKSSADAQAWIDRYSPGWLAGFPERHAFELDRPAS